MYFDSVNIVMDASLDSDLVEQHGEALTQDFL